MGGAGLRAFLLTTRRSRILLGTAVALLVTVFALLAVGLVHNRATQRNAADHRFRDEITVTTAMMNTIFGSSAPQSSQRSAAELGSPKVSLDALNDRVKADHSLYGVVLDDQGQLLAATTGAGPDVIRRLLAKPSYVDAALKGAPYRVSGFTDPRSVA